MRRVSILTAFLSISLVAGLALAGTSPAVTHEIRVRLDPASRELRVEDKFAVDAVGAIKFELAPWLKLVEARVNAKRAEARRTGRLVTIPLPAEGSRQVELVLQGPVNAFEIGFGNRGCTDG